MDEAVEDGGGLRIGKPGLIPTAGAWLFSHVFAKWRQVRESHEHHVARISNKSRLFQLAVLRMHLSEILLRPSRLGLERVAFNGDHIQPLQDGSCIPAG